MSLTLCIACGQHVDDYISHAEIEHGIYIGHKTPSPIGGMDLVSLTRIDTTGSAFSCCEKNVKIIDSRKRQDYVIRRKECTVCKGRFTTVEVRTKVLDNRT